MDEYVKLLDQFTKKYYCKLTNNGWGVKSAFIPDEEAMSDYIILCAVAKSSPMTSPNIIRDEMERDEFRGPDWYFFDGYFADRNGPGRWWFETLFEKKEKFKQFCDEYPIPEGESSADHTRSFYFMMKEKDANE